MPEVKDGMYARLRIVLLFGFLGGGTGILHLWRSGIFRRGYTKVTQRVREVRVRVS